jgi:hypothetical protein
MRPVARERERERERKRAREREKEKKKEQEKEKGKTHVIKYLSRLAIIQYLTLNPLKKKIPS